MRCRPTILILPVATNKIWDHVHKKNGIAGSHELIDLTLRPRFVSCHCLPIWTLKHKTSSIRDLNRGECP